MSYLRWIVNIVIVLTTDSKKVPSPPKVTGNAILPYQPINAEEAPNAITSSMLHQPFGTSVSTTGEGSTAIRNSNAIKQEERLGHSVAPGHDPKWRSPQTGEFSRSAKCKGCQTIAVAYSLHGVRHFKFNPNVFVVCDECNALYCQRCQYYGYVSHGTSIRSSASIKRNQGPPKNKTWLQYVTDPLSMLYEEQENEYLRNSTFQ